MASPNDLQETLAQLETVTTSLRHSYRELGTLQAAEVQNRAHAWLASNDTTVNGRRDYSAHMTAETKAEILTLQGDISALECERDLLKTKITLLAGGLV